MGNKGDMSYYSRHLGAQYIDQNLATSLEAPAAAAAIKRLLDIFSKRAH